MSLSWLKNSLVDLSVLLSFFFGIVKCVLKRNLIVNFVVYNI